MRIKSQTMNLKAKEMQKPITIIKMNIITITEEKIIMHQRIDITRKIITIQIKIIITILNTTFIVMEKQKKLLLKIKLLH